MKFKALFFSFLITLTFNLMASNEVDEPILNEREVSVLYYQGEYVPSKISVFEGEDLVLHFGNFSGTPQCLWSKSLDFFTSTYQGKVSSSTLSNLKPGSYSLSCPSEKGSRIFELVVLSKKTEKPDTAINRAPSSVRTSEWVPRDEGDSYFETSLNTPENYPAREQKFKRNYNFRVDNQLDDYENYFEGGQ